MRQAGGIAWDETKRISINFKQHPRGISTIPTLESSPFARGSVNAFSSSKS